MRLYLAGDESPEVMQAGAPLLEDILARHNG